MLLFFFAFDLDLGRSSPLWGGRVGGGAAGRGRGVGSPFPHTHGRPPSPGAVQRADVRKSGAQKPAFMPVSNVKKQLFTH